MIDLTGQIGELRFSVEIKRKETGAVEKYELVGFLDEDKLKELQDGSNTLNSGPQCSD